MTKQQHLDEAAPTPKDLDEAAEFLGWDSYAAIISHTLPSNPERDRCAELATRIHAHATTLEALAERDRVLGEMSAAILDALPWTEPGKCISINQRERLAALAAPYRVKVDQDAEDLKAILDAAFPRYPWGDESLAAALAKFREIVAQRGEVK